MATVLVVNTTQLGEGVGRVRGGDVRGRGATALGPSRGTEREKERILECFSCVGRQLKIRGLILSLRECVRGEGSERGERERERRAGRLSHLEEDEVAHCRSVSE